MGAEGLLAYSGPGSACSSGYVLFLYLLFLPSGNSLTLLHVMGSTMRGKAASIVVCYRTDVTL